MSCSTSYPEILLGKPRRRPPFSALAVRHEIQVTFKLGKVGASLGKVCACLHHMLYTKLFRRKRSNPRAFSGFFISVIKEAIIRQKFRIFTDSVNNDKHGLLQKFLDHHWILAHMIYCWFCGNESHMKILMCL